MSDAGPRPTADTSTLPWTEPFVVDPDANADVVHTAPTCPDVTTVTDRQRELTRVTWRGVRERHLWPCETCFPSDELAPVIVTGVDGERSSFHTQWCHMVSRAGTIRWIPRRQAREHISVDECRRCVQIRTDAGTLTGESRAQTCPRCGTETQLLPRHIHGRNCNPGDGGDT